MSNIRSYAGELLNRADRITGDQEKRSEQLEQTVRGPRIWI